MKQIKITIEENGDTVVEAIGFKGKSCQDATKQIEQALGSVQKSTKKPEFYIQATGTVNT